MTPMHGWFRTVPSSFRINNEIMQNINLLISLPVGIAIILLLFTALVKFLKLEIYISAGILALVTIFVYGIVAILAWPGADVFAIHLALYLMTIYAVSIISRSLTGKTRWHWAPMLIIGFFLVVVSVDTVLIMLAQSGLSPQWAGRLLPKPVTNHDVQSRFPGTVSHDFREKESQFNEYRLQRQLQTQRGWSVRVGWQDNAVTGRDSTLILEVKDKAGHDISDADVTGKMLFAGNMKLDQRFSMSYLGDGRYTTHLNMPHPGHWDFIILIERGEAQHELRVSTVVQDANQK